MAVAGRLRRKPLVTPRTQPLLLLIELFCPVDRAQRLLSELRDVDRRPQRSSAVQPTELFPRVRRLAGSRETGELVPHDPCRQLHRLNQLLPLHSAPAEETTRAKACCEVSIWVANLNLSTATWASIGGTLSIRSTSSSRILWVSGSGGLCWPRIRRKGAMYLARPLASLVEKPVVNCRPRHIRPDPCRDCSVAEKCRPQLRCGCPSRGASGRSLRVLGTGAVNSAAQVTVVAHHTKRANRRLQDSCALLALSVQTSFPLLGFVASDEHNGLCFIRGHVEGEGVLLTDLIHDLEGIGELVQHAFWRVFLNEDRQVVHECGIEERRDVLVVLSTEDTLARRGRGAGDALLGWPLFQ